MVAVSERKTEGILPGSRNVLFGIAASNLANEKNPGYVLPEQVEQLAKMLLSHKLGVELQFENLSPGEVPIFPKPAFLGIHQPLVGVDLADQRLRDESFRRLFDAMQIAHDVGAEYFTLHMQTRDYWDDFASRDVRIKNAFGDMDVIADRHKDKGYDFRLLIENVEFPKFPATQKELLMVSEYVERRSDVPMGLALDVGHLWHSGFLELENLWRPELSEIADGWGRQNIPFEQYLEETFQATRGKLFLIHLTGCRDHRTHDLPGTLSEDPSFATPDRPYGPNELDIRQSLQAIYEAASQMDGPARVINEAMGYQYGAIVENTLALQAISDSKISE